MKKKRVLMALMAALLILALSRLDAGGLWHSIQQIPLWSVIALIGLQILSQLLVNLQWHRIAGYAGVKLSFRKMFLINCQGAVVDAITPGVKIGGEVARSVQISRLGECPGEQAAAVVAVQKLFSLSAFCFICIFAAGYLIGEASFLQSKAWQFSVYGVLLFFLLLFAGVFLMPGRIMAYMQSRKKSRFSWTAKLRDFLIALLEQVVYFRENTRRWIALLLLSLLIWLMYPLKLALLAAQISPGFHVISVGAIAFAAYMVAMIPIFPGGLGGFEGTMTGLLLASGFMRSDAVVVTVLFRFITFWFVMLFSLVFAGLYKKGGFDSGT